MCKRIIDWDDVSTMPIKLSAIGIVESFFRSDPMYSLDPQNAHFFQAEVTRIEQQKSSLTKLSQLFLHSREHMFLYEILSQSVNFRFLRWRHSQLFGGRASTFIGDYCDSRFRMGRILQFLLYK